MEFQMAVPSPCSVSLKRAAVLGLVLALVPSVYSLAMPGVFTPSVGGSGEGTFYGNPGDNGDGGTCSFGPLATRDYAAFPRAVWDNAAYCGACISATGPKGSVVVQITDQCEACAAGDIDFSYDSFVKIADESQGRVAITWQWVDCPFSGPITYNWQSGSNQFWYAIQVRGTGKLIRSLEVNGASLPRQFYNYFTGKSGSSAPVSVKVTFFDSTCLVDSNVPIGQEFTSSGIRSCDGDAPPPVVSATTQTQPEPTTTVLPAAPVSQQPSTASAPTSTLASTATIAASTPADTASSPVDTASATVPRQTTAPVPMLSASSPVSVASVPTAVPSADSIGQFEKPTAFPSANDHPSTTPTIPVVHPEQANPTPVHPETKATTAAVNEDVHVLEISIPTPLPTQVFGFPIPTPLPTAIEIPTAIPSAQVEQVVRHVRNHWWSLW